ncbi:MAG TPA: hypothetical protein VD998_02285 [Verrucomicrobiae bacterium]|nr:hypothetical protein [Verrucomicrobiae bacterium]
MQKIIILILGLSLTAASCNLLGGGGGSKGVLKSDDGGKSFHPAIQLAEKKTIGGVSVNIMTMDSDRPDTIYLGSSNGIFKTEDGAASWRQILTGIAVSDIASDPAKPSTIYAVGLAGRNGKIIKSPDGGATWADIYTEPSKSNAVTTISVSKANSRILLAGLTTGEIIRSTDEGVTWQVVRDLQDPLLRIRFYNSSTAYALTLTKGLNKSTDQGSNWSPLPVSDLQLPSTGSTVRRYLDMSFDQKLSGVIFLATEQGLLRTVDDGVMWSVMYLPVRDTSLKVTAVAVNPNDSNGLYIAVGSTLFKSTNGGVTWETIKLPSNQTVRQITVNPSTPNVIYLGMGDNK